MLVLPQDVHAFPNDVDSAKIVMVHCFLTFNAILHSEDRTGFGRVDSFGVETAIQWERYQLHRTGETKSRLSLLRGTVRINAKHRSESFFDRQDNQLEVRSSLDSVEESIQAFGTGTIPNLPVLRPVVHPNKDYNFLFHSLLLRFREHLVDQQLSSTRFMPLSPSLVPHLSDHMDVIVSRYRSILQIRRELRQVGTENRRIAKRRGSWRRRSDGFGRVRFSSRSLSKKLSSWRDR